MPNHVVEMMKKIQYLLLLFASTLFAQQSETITLNWKQEVNYNLEDFSFKIPQFQSEYYDIDVSDKKISFKKVVDVSAGNATLQIIAVNYQSISSSELYDLNLNFLSSTINSKFEVVSARDSYKGLISFQLTLF